MSTKKKPSNIKLSFKSWDDLWQKKTKDTIKKRKRDVRIPEFTVDNIVTTFKLSHPVDLQKCSEEIYFLEYNCSKFTAATIRLRVPHTTALTFSSGSVVCTGAKSVEESLESAHAYTNIIKSVYETIEMGDFRVQNIVASAKCGFTIDLIGIADAFGVRTSFEIEVFPGLVFRLDQPKIVFLVFRSGSIVITGSNSVETIRRIFTRFFTHVLLTHRDEGIHKDVSNSAEYKRIIIHRS